MKIQKSELAEKLNTVKSIVPKKTTSPILQNVMIANGNMIANDMEVFAKVKLEYEGDESVLIPMEAFDLINSLPDGEVEFTIDDNIVTVKAKRIKNKYTLRATEGYPMPNIEGDMKTIKIDAEKFVQAIRKVQYAIGAQENGPMGCLCLRAKEGKLHFIALEGHMISWDRMDYDGEFELLIPKSAVNRLSSMGLKGEMTISHSPNGAVFTTEGYEIGTRLNAGKYFDVEHMISESPIHAVAEKNALLEALNRARMCLEENTPVKMVYDSEHLDISSAGRNKEYSETIDLLNSVDKIDISFNPRMLIDCIKSIDEEYIDIGLSNEKSPAYIKGEGNGKYITMLLPVRTR